MTLQSIAQALPEKKSDDREREEINSPIKLLEKRFLFIIRLSNFQKYSSLMSFEHTIFWDNSKYV